MVSHTPPASARDGNLRRRWGHQQRTYGCDPYVTEGLVEALEDSNLDRGGRRLTSPAEQMKEPAELTVRIPAAGLEFDL
jgi:hypothetical protein